MYREITKKIQNILGQKKSPIVLLLGLRQTGKTTLAKNISKKQKIQLFNFDLQSNQQEFLNPDRHSLELFSQRYKGYIIVIDEFQKLPEASNVIKHLYDNFGIKFILTGSSELKIRKNAGDSLAGRITTFNLYPLSLKEILVQDKIVPESGAAPYDKAQTILKRILVHGSLPSLQNISNDNWENYLTEFTETLLSKDVLEMSGIRKSTKIYTLAKLLAMQIGQLVNVNELATLLELPRTTIYNYLDILEQMSLIKRSHPISTNERRAIASKFKVYFTDLGIRNYLVGNFSSVGSRLDTRQLLENYSFISIKRSLDYAQKNYNLGFFRSESGSEIDIVLKTKEGEKLYEVKTNPKRAKKDTGIIYITMETAYEL